MSGTTCTGTACGTFTNMTIGGATYNAPASVSASLTVTVTATSVADSTKSMTNKVVINPLPSITTTSLAGGTVGTAYSATVQSSGGTTPVTWSVTQGSLPANLTLNSSSGAISGTPSAAGISNFTVTAKDSSTPALSASQALSITINNVSLAILTTSLPAGTVNTAYSQSLQASGGTPPYSWTVATGSSLPAWLSIGGSGTNWTLSGKPTASGTSSFSLTVTDSSTPTAQSATTQPLSVIVNAASGACGSGNESVLKGQYAFSLSGFNSSGYMAALGSFSANGTGGITAGTVDSNGIPLGVQTGSITASASSYLLCGLGQSRLRHHRYTLLHLHHPLRS